MPYTKDGSPLYIELHRHLFDSAEDAHDELNHFSPTSIPSRWTAFSPCRPTSICCTCFCTPTSTSSAAASGCGSSATLACGCGRITGRSTGSACTSSVRASTRRPLLRRRVRLQRPNAPPFLHRHAERREGQLDGGEERRPADGVPQAGVFGAALPVPQKAPVPAAGRMGAAPRTLRQRKAVRHG